MRYVDNGIVGPRDMDLLPVLQELLTTDVVGVRWQSGFFDEAVLGLFAPALQRLAHEDREVAVLVGSNLTETRSSAVHALVDSLALPRRNARLGIVSYAGGLYHPKTVHISYRSGREVAYVGSANLTSPGLSGLNVEAGVVLDTDEGDSAGVLGDIRRTVDEWFETSPEGLFEVRTHDDVDELEERGIVSATVLAETPSSGQRSTDIDVDLPRRRPRHSLPSMPDSTVLRESRVGSPPSGQLAVTGDVLIAELTGSDRWAQSAFPRWFTRHFFAVLEDTGDVLRLLPVTEGSGVGQEELRQCIHKGSGNWTYELGLAVGPYPRPPELRPLGIFHRIGHQTCRYTILRSTSESYSALNRFLGENLDRIPRHGGLRRTIVSADELWDASSFRWFFEA